tara:strand:+ start:107 stop:493 length:387 start_codon:yes stop_codon:yes gene_type:complete
MLLFFLIISIILASCLFFIEIQYKKLASGPAFLKMIGFLIISIGLSFLMNHFINPSTSYIPPSDSNKDNKNKDDNKSVEPNLLKALKKSIKNTGSNLGSAFDNEKNFFASNKNMFGFFDIFKQLFKNN